MTHDLPFQALLAGLHMCSPCFAVVPASGASRHGLLTQVSLQAAVWKAGRQSTSNMVLSKRPLLEEAAVCLSTLAPAAQLEDSQALLLAYLDICADCGDWQSAVIMLRCHLIHADQPLWPQQPMPA